MDRAETISWEFGLGAWGNIGVMNASNGGGVGGHFAEMDGEGLAVADFAGGWAEIRGGSAGNSAASGCSR